MKNIFLIFCFVIAFSNSAYSETKIFSCTEWNLDNPLKDDDAFKFLFKNKRGIPFIAKKSNREYEIKNKHEEIFKLTYLGKFNSDISLYTSYNKKYNSTSVYSIYKNKEDGTLEIKEFAVNSKYTYRSKCYP